MKSILGRGNNLFKGFEVVVILVGMSLEDRSYVFRVEGIRCVLRGKRELVYIGF